MKNLILKIISNEEVNTNRQIEFDICKTLSVFFMVLIHTWVYLSESYEEFGTLSYFVTTILCSLFGASLFMMCMGIGFDYTKNRDNPNFFINRGIKMFGSAYLLNITRSLINVFITTPYLTGSFQFETLLFCWFNVDIMQFAGLAILTFGIFKKLKLKPWTMFIISFVIAVIAKFIPMFTTKNALFDLLLGTIFPNGFLGPDRFYSYFPLMNYLIFPMFGYAYGLFYKRIKNKKLYYSIVIPICAFISIGYTCLAIKYGWDIVASEVEYYHLSFYNSLICILAGIFILGIYYFISLALPKSVCDVFTRLSSNINKIYCIHWVILYNLWAILRMKYPTVPGSNSLTFNETTATIIGLSIYIISAILAKLFVDFKKKRAKI